jgi:hypothetical protein
LPFGDHAIDMPRPGSATVRDALKCALTVGSPEALATTANMAAPATASAAAERR